MPTTRLQSTKIATPKIEETTSKPPTTTTRRARKGTITARAASSKRKTKNALKADDNGNDKVKEDQKEQAGPEEEQVNRGIKAEEEDQPPAKKKRGRTGPRRREVEVVYKEGVIERGHVYFFYRPKVQLEEVESLDDVRHLHMVLVPRPPLWLESTKLSSQQEEGTMEKKEVDPDMKVLSSGADVVPVPEPKDASKKYYRIVTIGKKQLPTLESMAKTKQRGGGHPVFWGTVTAVGDELEELERGMEEKTYETKTRGTRHMEPARLVARGVYAIVNRESPKVPSERKSNFVYRISHPPPGNLGEVQHAFGILDAAAFVIQIKNPLAPQITPQQPSNRAQYPEELIRAVFGAGTGGKGRSNYGLRFAPCETPDLLDYKGAELLFIAGREGQSGVEESIGEERGHALKEADEQEEQETIDDIYKELGLDMEKFPAEPLKGEWI